MAQSRRRPKSSPRLRTAVSRFSMRSKPGAHDGRGRVHCRRALGLPELPLGCLSGFGQATPEFGSKNKFGRRLARLTTQGARTGSATASAVPKPKLELRVVAGWLGSADGPALEPEVDGIAPERKGEDKSEAEPTRGRPTHRHWGGDCRWGTSAVLHEPTWSTNECTHAPRLAVGGWRIGEPVLGGHPEGMHDPCGRLPPSVHRRARPRLFRPALRSRRGWLVRPPRSCPGTPTRDQRRPWSSARAFSTRWGSSRPAMSLSGPNRDRFARDVVVPATSERVTTKRGVGPDGRRDVG